MEWIFTSRCILCKYATTIIYEDRLIFKAFRQNTETRCKRKARTYHYITVQLGLKKPMWKTRWTQTEKKIARTSSKGFKSGEITRALVASAVDSKLPSLFNLSVSLPHALRRPFIQPRLGWILCYLPGKELFFAAPSRIHFEKRIKSSLWPSIQAC